MTSSKKKQGDTHLRWRRLGHLIRRDVVVILVPLTVELAYTLFVWLYDSHRATAPPL